MISKKITGLCLVLLFIVLQISAQNDILSDSIKLENKNYQLDELINLLETRYEIKFAYDDEILNNGTQINITQESIKTELLLQKICTAGNLNYKILQGQILLFKKSRKGKATLSGYIIDSASGESLPSAYIFVKETGQGTISNDYGFYSLSLPQGVYNIEVAYTGYESTNKQIVLKENRSNTIKLKTCITEIKEVIISENRNPTKTDRIEIGMDRLNMKEISAIPSFLGEVDVLKGFQFLPGVQSVNDGISHFSVRGGTFDQNLILLDEAPVYNPTHVLGFFSVFNPDAVAQAELYKGYIPAKFGGRISSVMDVRMKEGDRNRLRLTGNINTYASRLCLETPLFNDKTSLLIAGRYSYTMFMGIIGSATGAFNYSFKTKVNFWDLNLKLNHRLNDKNHLFLSAYNGNDNFFFPQINDKSTIEWGNSTATFRWNHVFNNKLFSNTSFIYSNYNYQYLYVDNGYNYNWEAGMRQGGIKSDFDYFINTSNRIKFGFSVNNHLFQPGKIEPVDSVSSLVGYQLENKSAIESSAYLSHKVGSGKFGIESGLRINSFISDYDRAGEETGKNYLNFAPRLALIYKINPHQSIKLAYSKTWQYMHLLKNASVGFPTDIWLPSDSHIKPQSADQFSIGYFADFSKKQYEFSIEAYYKKMHNILDFVDNAELFLNEEIETQIRSGTGESYGLEVMLSKKIGRLKGNIAYTLSKSEKTINGINNNEPYPFMHDNRHCFDINLNYAINDRWSFMIGFTYKSGAATTMAKGFYFWEDIPFTFYSARNGYRLPAYHRMDIAFTRKNRVKPGRRWTSEWTFGINNVYNRQNIFALYMERVSYNNFGDIKQLSLFGVMPFVSYKIKF
jgi:hypothetical protein